MYIYYFLIQIAAFFGNVKAKKLIQGQRNLLQQIREYVSTLKAGEKVTWIHVASVGEFEQARPLIEQAEDKRKILLTFFSPSGYELRKDYKGVDAVFYLPFPTRRNAKQFVQMVPMEKVIFVKYEFWPAYLKALQARQIPTYLISAIFRKDQLFFKPWGRWYLQLLHVYTHIFVQDEQSANLLQSYGIEGVTVAGDTRFDRVCKVKENGHEIEVVADFVRNKPRVLIAGSTWPEDERLLVRYQQAHPDTYLVLVPHEITESHLHELFQLLEGKFTRYTQARAFSVKNIPTLLVDTIGLLSSIYRYGHVAYIGGGFGEGIHNTLEAAVYGMPVVFGPNYKRFREAIGLLQADAAHSVRNYKELEAALDDAFERQAQMGRNATQYVEAQRGATEVIRKGILKVKGER